MSQVHALQIHEAAISEPLAVPAYAAPVTTTTTGEPPAGTPTPPVEATRRLVSLDAFRGITIAAMLLVNDPGHGRAYDALDHVEWHGWTMTDLIFPFFLFIVGVAIPFSMAKRSALVPRTRGQKMARVWLRALSIFMLGALLAASSVAGISLNLGHRAAGVSLIEFGDVGAGHTPLKILRVAAWTFCILGVFALLVPYRSRKLQIWVPIGVTIGFLILIFAVGFANRAVWPAGPPDGVSLGGGILHPAHFRIPGVLQRIGICYGIAGTIAIFFGRRMIFGWFVALLAIYSVIMLAAPIHNSTTGEAIPWYSPDRLTKQDNVARRVDEAVFDRWTVGPDGRRVYQWHHTYAPYPDNEGLVSTIPAIGTVLLGILVGLWLRSDRTAAERAGGLMACGVVVAVLGWCLDAWLMPINKNLWTPSFVLLTGGLGMLGLGTMFWQIDVNRRRRWAWPLVVYGMNAIAAFVAASLLSKIDSAIKFPLGDKRTSLGSYVADQAAAGVHHFNGWLHQLSPRMPDVATPANTSLAFALMFVLAVFVLMVVLYVCRVFVKV